MGRRAVELTDRGGSLDQPAAWRMEARRSVCTQRDGVAKSATMSLVVGKLAPVAECAVEDRTYKSCEEYTFAWIMHAMARGVAKVINSVPPNPGYMVLDTRIPSFVKALMAS
ncbi:hypothetical protein AXG93_2550s1170 [Marchantia polymorpha subsp. ruderalis]|uniref:Uncharacterized protein n=1 Tax=Marchantia polymorpha subsp. ruderalis TaxID=1480154 RepID=A0A176VLK1_MARPO|nr:hypothetical protein AXG93_2550s1170 [Marchantia polymorpha subsp. ruderalis]